MRESILWTLKCRVQVHCTGSSRGNFAMNQQTQTLAVADPTQLCGLPSSVISRNTPVYKTRKLWRSEYYLDSLLLIPNFSFCQFSFLAEAPCFQPALAVILLMSGGYDASYSYSSYVPCTSWRASDSIYDVSLAL